ncbi:MAG TPA: FAD-dependent oxidoreductase [Verrucomicrobiae bacterium]|nr:FAD-dependent oxidoreductase [Verrucomicrobiae bacterium]
MLTTLTLKEKAHLIADVWAFRFVADQPVQWIAGQYMSVELPHDQPDGKGTKRWFTISSAPYEGIIQITTRLTDSSFKRALAALPIGGKLPLLDQPHGNFVWQDTTSPLIFVAGGIGITAFRTILRQRAHEGSSLAVHLLYGNRTHDIVFKEEFDNYAANDPHFTVDYVVGEPLNVAKLAKLAPNLNKSLVYVSGPTMMVTALGKELEGAGLPSSQLKQDFYPSYSEMNY